MQTLDDYLTGEFHTDKRALRELEQAVEKVVRTLVLTCDESQGWAYQIEKKYTKPGSVSQSTILMITSALGMALNLDQAVNIEGERTEFDFPPLKSKVSANGEELKDAARDRLGKAVEVLKKDIGTRKRTVSSSYGEADPITTPYLVRTSRYEPAGRALKEVVEAQLESENYKDFNFDRASSFWKNTDDPAVEVEAKPKQQASETEPLKARPKDQASSCAFIPLKVLRSWVLQQTQANAVHDKADEFRRFFETRLHDQLSFSEIPDSRFDPAELAFCLEGLLISQRSAVDRVLMDRVLGVMGRAQEREAHWRPTTPFLSTQQGFTLFPVSVEVANSLLRSCVRFDGDAVHGTMGTKYRHLFQRYWQWLNARREEFRCKIDGTEHSVVGWHSEHVNRTGLIHTWETALVLEFMVAYHRFLQAHIARVTLDLSRFKYERPTIGAKEPQDWNEVVKSFEPVSSLGDKLKVYETVGNRFVTPRQNGASSSEPDWSILLYGPPGTGKTTLADNLAKHLGWRLITITVSDFLAGGGAELEARAKAIFEVLQAQSNAVVLFDEIDNFLLDRDTRRYADQDSAFQFMTPGMLTKINDLRKSERVIFIIATNYENRIDPAIKRPGRIDHQLLLLPFDGAQRKSKLIEFDKKRPKGHQKTENAIDDLTKKSLFLSYTELKGLANSPKAKSNADFAQALEQAPRSVRLESYRHRFPPLPNESDKACLEEPGHYPIEEFLALLALRLETEEPLSNSEEEVVKRALIALDLTERPNGEVDATNKVSEALRSFAPRLPEEVTETVKKTLADAANPDTGGQQ